MNYLPHGQELDNAENPRVVTRIQNTLITAGLEPATFGSEDQCSTIEPGDLHFHTNI